MGEFTDRQNEIIEQALSVIAEQGIEKLTYRNLAKTLGITEPAFYRHFGSKTEIMNGILVYFDSVRRRLFEDIRARAADSLAAIEAIFTEHFSLFQSNHGLATLLFPEEIRQGRHELEAKVLEVMSFGQQQIVQIIAEGIRGGEIRPDLDPEQLALMISGSLRLLVTRWRLNKYVDDLQAHGARFWRTLSALIRQPAVSAGRRGGTVPDPDGGTGNNRTRRGKP